VAWTVLDRLLTVEVPAGARAQVDIPGGEVFAVGPGSHVFTTSDKGSRQGSEPGERYRARST